METAWRGVSLERTHSRDEGMNEVRILSRVGTCLLISLLSGMTTLLALRTFLSLLSFLAGRWRCQGESFVLAGPQVSGARSGNPYTVVLDLLNQIVAAS